MRDSSRRRYRDFTRAYRAGHLEQLGKPGESGGAPTSPSTPDKTAAKRGASESGARGTRRREYLRLYIRWLWRFWPSVALLIGLALVGAAATMIHPLFLRHIVDHVLLDTQGAAAERLRRLHMVGGAFLAVIVVGKLMELTRDYRQRQLNVRVMLSLRRSLFDRMLRLPVQRLHDLKTGGAISRLTSDIDTTTGLLQMALISPTVSLINLVIAFGVLFTLNAMLALTALAIVPGVMLISFSVSRRIRPIYRNIREDSAEVDARVSEAVGGIRVVRAFRRERRELLTFLIARHGIVRKQLFAHRRELLLWSAWGLMLTLVNLVIVWFGGYLAISGRATVGDIMAFQVYTVLLLNPVWQIVNSFSELQRSLAAMERVFEILEAPSDMPDRDDAVDAPAAVDELRFEHVFFEYREGQPVVRDLDVSIQGGSTVALVGRSGAGKTTITDLVARFYDPTSGRVLVNGVDIRDYRLETYRRLLGVVQQDVFLFDGTVRENIAYGRPSATLDEVIDAARRANAHEFIAQLADGYETRVGERGVKLSGGQCQRLSIARALLASPQILVLDEATSNLDTESEQLIQGALRELLRDRTTFVVAHRLSTITHADLILVLDAGVVVERGTHAELMAQGGVYQEMVRRQQEAHSEGWGTDVGDGVMAP